MQHTHPLRRFLYNNSLSLVLFGLFFASLVGLSITGYLQGNQDLQAHQQQTISLGQYLMSGEFIEAVFENWESEFLQMGALVVLTIFLKQKGSPDSKHLRGKEAVDASPKQKGLHAFIYENSLSLALFGLFVISFILHAIGGTSAHNQEALEHGEQQLGVLNYLASSQFWFESFQNWQSEFLAVGALIVLSIYLRQRGSPESKAVIDSNQKTGE